MDTKQIFPYFESQLLILPLWVFKYYIILFSLCFEVTPLFIKMSKNNISTFDICEGKGRNIVKLQS